MITSGLRGPGKGQRIPWRRLDRMEVITKKLPRREREKLRQRQEMLDTALSLFSEKGYHNVSMHEIAEKAEFAIGTLYKFFKSKDDLYEALMLELSDRFRMVLHEAIEHEGDEIEKLRSYVKAKGKVFCENASAIRLYFSETHGAGFTVLSGLDEEIKRRRKEFLKKLAMIFDEGIKRDRFIKMADPFVLAVALDSLVNAFLFLWLEDPDQHPYPEEPDAILNILFKGLLIK